MKAKIFRILGVGGFIVAICSLSACFDGPYFPARPAYSYSSPSYAYPEYVPSYVPTPRYVPTPQYVPVPQPVPQYVPTPRYYAYNPHPYWQNQQRWEQEEHEKQVQHQQQVAHDHDWHKYDQDQH